MTNTVVREDVMTDFQFRAIMTMVHKIMDNAENFEEAKKSIEKLAAGELPDIKKNANEKDSAD